MSDSKEYKIKDFMKTEGVNEIKKRFESYVKLLKEGKKQRKS